MKIRHIFFAVAVVLAVSLAFNLFFVYLLAQNQNTFNNMRARALASYGSELVTMEVFLEKYLDTRDYDIIQHEVWWGIARSIWTADVCVQGLDQDSGLIYYELKGVGLAIELFFVYSSGVTNTTKVQVIAGLLGSIGRPFSGLDISENEDPLQHLIESDVDTVISQCRQLRDLIGYHYP